MTSNGVAELLADVCGERSALIEFGLGDEAESALAAFERDTWRARSRPRSWPSPRHAGHAVRPIRLAIRLGDQTVECGRRIGLADADNVSRALRVAAAAEGDLE